MQNETSIFTRNYDDVLSFLTQILEKEANQNISSSPSHCGDSPSINHHQFTRDPSFVGNHSPDNSTIPCLCAIILSHIHESNRLDYIPPPEFSLFNSREKSVPPAMESSPGYVLHVLKTFNTFAQIETEYMIAAVIYMERVLKSSNNKLRICSQNWHRILWISMVLASKVWDDFAMSNSDYSQIFSNMTLPLLNRMEYEILTLFNYEVSLNPEEYVFYNNTFIAMILEAKLKNSIALLDQQQCLSIPSSSPTSYPLHSSLPPSSALSQTTISKSTRTLFVSSEVSYRTEGVYSSTSTSLDHEEGDGESVDEDDGDISPLPPPLTRQFSRQLSSSRFRYGSHLSPVLSEFVSHSHSQSFSLTPIDDAKFNSSISACPSGASINSLPLGRKRLISEELLELNDVHDEDFPPLSVKNQSNPLGNRNHDNKVEDHEEEVKEKKRIFQLILQIRKNRIQPAPGSSYPQSPPILTLPGPQQHPLLPLKQSQSSFIFKPSTFFSKLSFRDIFPSSCNKVQTSTSMED